jgi:hypothetical protein
MQQRNHLRAICVALSSSVPVITLGLQCSQMHATAILIAA